ncbi:hypothetical protein [Streptomyces paromomycinus]|uniref:DUF4461 domain-containing protein n=1 Tax=Streptomyces paromomycinus TaxID=92743 RepID=A0A401W4E6_STREY|nr:hypothetical protein [Streptomyces paromomycinus]GCD44207.1 hypothetical protein GKJPGBOP_03898 [Streptomyces paromomycinus]
MTPAADPPGKPATTPPPDADATAEGAPDDSTDEPIDEGATGGENDAARRRRRAQFLRDLNEAKELRDRVQPRRARAARMRQAMRMRTFRW